MDEINEIFDADHEIRSIGRFTAGTRIRKPSTRFSSMLARIIQRRVRIQVKQPLKKHFARQQPIFWTQLRETTADLADLEQRLVEHRQSCSLCHQLFGAKIVGIDASIKDIRKD